jgi:hypothetical protein
LKTDELERQSSYYIEKESVEELKWLPDLIKGDLDSLRDDVRAYYESMVSLSSEATAANQASIRLFLHCEAKTRLPLGPSFSEHS